MRLHNTLCLLLTVVLVAVAFSGCPKQQTTTGAPGGMPGAQAPVSTGDEIVIGAYFGNTGGFATFGQSSTKAIRLATDEINASGGVLGKQIKLVVEDDQCKPEEAANAAQKLIQQDKALCVIGEVASSNSLAAAPICQKAVTPMVKC